MPVAEEHLLTVHAAVLLTVEHASLACGAFAIRVFKTCLMIHKQLMQATTQLVAQTTRQRVRRAARRHVMQPIRQQVQQVS